MCNPREQAMKKKKTAWHLPAEEPEIGSDLRHHLQALLSLSFYKAGRLWHECSWFSVKKQCLFGSSDLGTNSKIKYSNFKDQKLCLNASLLTVVLAIAVLYICITK